MAILFLMLFFAGNAEFFEMVDTQTKQGYTWEYVGETEVTNEVALPAVDERTGKKYYYWYLTAPK
jgi:hypothetical protein